MKITVGGREIDLEKALPIVVGDLRKLKKLGVNYPSAFDPRDPDHQALFLYHFCQKVDPAVTEAEIDLLSLEEVINAVYSLVHKKEGDEVLDIPTSGGSTTSPTTMDGGSAI